MYATPMIPEGLRRIIAAADAVHIHGLWRAHAVAAAKLARKYKKPYIVSAHGMLEAWALRNKRWKKIPYSIAVERPNLRAAACLRALTHYEARSFRFYGVTQPIAVIPNGVDAPAQLTPEPFLQMFPQLRDRRLILFLGRIHYVKGLDVLVQAWSRIRRNFESAHLVLAGPDSENTRTPLQQQIASLGLSDHVTFTGMLNETEKWSALTAADAFVLPSYSEAFSMAVLEAMAAGLPVIVTRQCSFPEVAAKECGWVVEPDPTRLEAALRECLAASTNERVQMGQRGKLLVRESYSWSSVGGKMADLVDWLVGGQLPSSVEILQ
jgi:glycosyltransferase involved in cell wall biosynthesis